jgi:hypothetical protein
MTWTMFSGYSFWRAAIVSCAIAFACAAGPQAFAASGPFAEFPGSWDGTGKIQIGDKTERIRCKATYSLQGSNESFVVLALTCASDSYKFDLSGNFQADSSNHISGNWSETSRGVGGSASGTARGDRFQLHVESTAITGNMVVVTRGSSQSVTIDTIGTEDKISASITLKRGSR